MRHDERTAVFHCAIVLCIWIMDTYKDTHFGESRLTGKKGPGAGTDSNLYACLVHRPLAAPACMHADAAVR